ncbi:MAG: hypothetical protein ACPH5P_00130 [Akkermansiaceae bacterium]
MTPAYRKYLNTCDSYIDEEHDVLLRWATDLNNAISSDNDDLSLEYIRSLTPEGQRLMALEIYSICNQLLPGKFNNAASIYIYRETYSQQGFQIRINRPAVDENHPAPSVNMRVAQLLDMSVSDTYVACDWEEDDTRVVVKYHKPFEDGVMVVANTQKLQETIDLPKNSNVVVTTGSQNTITAAISDKLLITYAKTMITLAHSVLGDAYSIKLWKRLNSPVVKCAFEETVNL